MNKIRVKSKQTQEQEEQGKGQKGAEKLNEILNEFALERKETPKEKEPVIKRQKTYQILEEKQEEEEKESQ